MDDLLTTTSDGGHIATDDGGRTTPSVFALFDRSRCDRVPGGVVLGVVPCSMET